MTAKKKLEAKITGVKPEYAGKFLRINEYEIEKDLHEGGKQSIKWLIMERGNAVGILAYDPVEDQVVLVNEMRTGILVDGGYPYTDTLPAGGIGKGETPVEAAVREMKEETGLDLKDARIIHEKSYVSAGGTSESISIIFGIVAAKKAGGIHGLAEEQENIKTTVMSSQDFMDKIDSGEINDLKTMVAGYWLMRNRDHLQKNYDPCPQIAESIKTMLRQGAPDKDIQDAVSEYGRYWENRERSYDARDFRDDLPMLFFRHSRFDLAFADDAAKDDSMGFGSSRFLEDRALYNLSSMVLDRFYGRQQGFSKTAGDNFVEWLSKKDAAFVDRFIEGFKETLDGAYVDSAHKVARLLKGTGREDKVDIWLKQADDRIEWARKNPTDYVVMGYGSEDYPTMPPALRNKEFIERIKEALDVEPVSKAVVPKRKGPK